MRRKIAVFLAGGILHRAAGIAVIASLVLFCLALIVLAHRSAGRLQPSASRLPVLSGSQSGTESSNRDSPNHNPVSAAAVSQTDPRYPKLRFDPQSILASPSFSDESQSSVLKLSGLSVSAKLDRLDIEGGMLKVSWGAADGFGPLDVVNPRDYSDQNGTDFLAAKIAQPMLHGSYSIGNASKIEAVFVYPNVRSPDGAQAGLRFTSAVGPADFGMQYYYGKLPKPSAFVDLPSPRDAALLIDNSRYSQLGANVSSTIGSMTVRGEIAAHLADDFSVIDGTVRHPSILWSVGTENALAGGMNLNAQYSGTGATDSIVTLRLSKKMIDDRLLLSTATLYDVESPECLVKTAMNWTMDSCLIELSGGVYTGLSGRELLRVPDHDYVKFTVSYDF